MLLPTDWRLPEAMAKRVGDEAGKQRLMQHDGHLLLILHEIPEPDTAARTGAFFWRNPEGEWRTAARGGGMAALQQHVKDYETTVDALDKRFDVATTAAAYFDVLRHITPILRATKNLHAVLQAAREALPDERRLIALRDDAYVVERTAELLRDDAKNALDYLVARRTEEQTAQGTELAMAANRLNMLAAIFLPITAVASVLGSNLHSGLEDLPVAAFWVIMAVSMVAGMALLLLLKPKPTQLEDTL